MNVKQFIAITFQDGKEYQQRNRIFCKDGFNISVQGSAGHYCQPRYDVKEYSSVELGFPSEEEILINEYAENVLNPTETVYGWTPIDVIEKVIEKHGGIDIDKTFKI